MKITEVIKAVLSDGCKLVRVRSKGDMRSRTPWEYDVKDGSSGKKKGWFYFDSFTASGMSAVHNALRPDLQVTFDCLSLPTLIDFTWKHVK